VWSSKDAAAGWALARTEDPGLVRAALAIRHGDRSRPLDPARVDQFIGGIQARVQRAAHRQPASAEATQPPASPGGPQAEEILAGGNMTAVTRVGDTVRRQAGPWTPAVHALLRHLRTHGFGQAPEPLGLDDQGREILSLLPGRVATYPLPPFVWSDETLVAIAQLLAAYHHATVGFVPPAGAVWQWPAHQPFEVVCHNDVAPYNLLFQQGRPTGLIDFDTASPGPRVWDLAYAAYRFVPMAHDGHAPVFGVPLPVDRPGRLRRLCDAYGLDDRGGFVDVLLGRIEAVCDLIVDQAVKGDPAFRQFLAEGHVAGYRRDLRLIESLRDRLARALG
jgi:hypothetical protein